MGDQLFILLCLLRVVAMGKGEELISLVQLDSGNSFSGHCVASSLAQFESV